jgi:hypothetical protein
MSSVKIELTNEQLQNLKIFLSRSDLKGIEVESFVEIINLLNPPGEEKDVK